LKTLNSVEKQSQEKMIKFIFKDEVQSIAILVKELEKVPCTIPKQKQ